MCEDCGGICARLDAMIDEYLELMGKYESGFSAGYRSRFHSTNVKGITGAADVTSLKALVEEAACIGMTSQALEVELSKRTGFKEAVSLWIREEKTPNGLVRKIILTNAEAILHECGAVPELSLAMAV